MRLRHDGQIQERSGQQDLGNVGLRQVFTNLITSVLFS